MAKKVSKKDPVDFRVARPALLDSAWASLINGLPVNDTRIYVHSRRKKSGVDMRLPSTVHASNAMLSAASSRFKKLLSNNQKIPYDGYESDSDFEDEPPHKVMHSLPSCPPSPDSSGFGDSRAVSLSESELVSELNLPDHIVVNCNALEAKPAGIPESLADERPPMPVGIHSAESLGPIQDGAHKTWQALIYYLWSSQVNFSPLRSRDVCEKAYADSHKDMAISRSYSQSGVTAPKIFFCSPKSMYRLAHMLVLEDLKEQALSHIRNNLTEYNIVHELFSDFTWRYPEVLEMESEVFGEYRRNEIVEEAMQQILAKVAAGELPHSMVVLRSVFKKLWTRY